MPPPFVLFDDLKQKPSHPLRPNHGWGTSVALGSIADSMRVLVLEHSGRHPVAGALRWAASGGGLACVSHILHSCSPVVSGVSTGVVVASRTPAPQSAVRPPRGRGVPALLHAPPAPHSVIGGVSTWWPGGASPAPPAPQPVSQ